MHRINTDVSKLLGEDRMQRIAMLTRLRRAWADMIGPMLAAATEPIEVRPQPDGSVHLIIAVNHSIMAQQIMFLRDDIRAACLQQCQIERIAKIFTRVQAVAGIVDEHPKRTARAVSFSKKKQLASALTNVKDSTLRRAMFQARLAQFIWNENA